MRHSAADGQLRRTLRHRFQRRDSQLSPTPVRSRLAWLCFSDPLDTEVIPAAVDAWGVERGLLSLRGMFAFALCDARARSLLLARDRVGILPLYWRSAATPFCSRQAKALFAPSLVRARINLVAIHDFRAHGYATFSKHRVRASSLVAPTSGLFASSGARGTFDQPSWSQIVERH